MDSFAYIVTKVETISDGKEWYQFIGQYVDTIIANRDTGRIDQLLQYVEGKTWPNTADYIFSYYIIGNLWTTKDEILRKDTGNNSWEYRIPELDQAIINLRKCVSIVPKNEIQKFCVAQAYTNLAGKMNHAGRFFKAIDYWDKALALKPTLGMAHCNKAYAMFWYYVVLDREYKKTTYLHTAFHLFRQYSHSQDVPIVFRHEFDTLRDRIFGDFKDPDFLFSPLEFPSDSLQAIEGNRYTQWCREEKLYLDSLLGVVPCETTWGDVEVLTGICYQSRSQRPQFHILFNQIKQEFITARYFLFLSTDLGEEIHHSDMERHLSFCGDFALYGIQYEYMKTAFRMAYSLFDKIAFFLENYLGLPPNSHLSFNSIWYKKQNILEDIAKLNNLPLRGLFFLSRDLYSKSEEWLLPLEPEAKEISSIRNSLEHMAFKVVHPMASDGTFEDDLSYSMRCDDFYLKTLNLLTMVREAILYLNFAVAWEEERRNDGKGIRPFPLMDYDGADLEEE